MHAFTAVRSDMILPETYFAAECGRDPSGAALPAELSDRIIDFVAFGTESCIPLRCCALTCKMWLPRSRFHLFHTVQIKTFLDYDRLDAILRHNPKLAYCIRNLNLEIGAAGVTFRNQGRVLPIELLARLPLVQSVKYYSALTFQTPSLRTQIANLPRIDTVISFSINVCVLQRLSDMIMLLSSFVSLRNLQLHEVFFLDRDYSLCLADTRYCKPLPLTSLHMGSLLEASAIFGWLSETGSIIHLSTISVGLDRSDHLTELNGFLRICGDAVKHISFQSRSLLGNKLNQLDLGYNISLHKLTFRIASLVDLRLLPALLATIRSPSLVKITIRLIPASDPPTWREIHCYLSPVHCAALDALLASVRFECVRSVVFDFACEIREEEIRPMLTSRFPLLSSQGRIEIV